MNTNLSERSFIPYPTNRVVGTIADAAHADAAVAALVKAGFERQSIDALSGDEGLSRLDPAGTEHGVLERLQRSLIRTGSPAEEYRYLMHHVEDVRAGRVVIMALAPGREARTVAADILNAHDAEFVGFYGRWAWRGLAPSRTHPDAEDATEARARAGQPEDMPRLFVEAWNGRDPDACVAIRLAQ